MKRSRVFVDTNVLIYMFDPIDAMKRASATQAIRALGSRMVISTQVLQEFYSIATRKLRMPFTTARDAVHEFSESEVISTTPSLVAEAIDLSIVTGYTVWDAMIVQAAITARCDVILTEDMSHGQTVKGIRIENPFSQ